MNNPYTSRTYSRIAQLWRLIPMLIALVAVNFSASAQTTLIDPAAGGGFELGTAFSDNGWTIANSASVNQWVLGTAVSGAPFANRTAYISTDGGGTNNYSNTAPTMNYFYQDVTVPAGETIISLGFNWLVNGESSWDMVQVFTAPTSITPVGTTTYPGSGLNNVPAGIVGATWIGSVQLQGVTIQTASFSLPGSLAGSTFRLIFGWKDDTSGGAAPAALDNISLVSALPSLFTAAVPGGLWNSPASWVGGVVPANGNDFMIPSGSTMVINQTVVGSNVTIAGKVQWTTTVVPSATVNAFTATNLTIDPGGEFIANNGGGTAALTTGGATVNIYDDFTNNGFAHMAAGGTVLWFLGTSGTQSLSGTGTFLADVDGRGMIQNMLCASLATSVDISTTQDIVTNNLGATAGTLNTNNKLHIDNLARCNGGLINRSIYTVVVNAHGTLYNSATPPTIGFTAAPVGGTTATATPNIDDVTGTLRSITITNAGDGYRTAPLITISGGTGSGATAVAHLYSSYMFGTVCQGQKSGSASVSGGINIPSSQGVAIAVTAGGTGYTSAPNIGVALPTLFLNLVTAGGSGYTSAPAVAFSGGGAITQATGVAIVTRGQVTSVSITAGGSGYLSAPTVTLTGGGGTGATAAYNPADLPTFSANIDATTGMLVSVTTTNPGFGYLAAPVVTLNPATGAGGATVNATLVSRASLYNLIHNWFAPAPVNVAHTESDFIPVNRRINAHSLTNSVGLGITFTNGLTLYASAPMPTFTGPINMGGNTLAFDHPTYLGVAGSATAYVENGSIAFRLFGSISAQSRQFPFNSYDGVSAFGNNLLNMGTATTVATEGSTITSVTASYVTGQTGTGIIGNRALRVQRNGLFGNNPTLRMTFNALDGLTPGVVDNPSLYVAQSSTNTDPWTIRSVTSGVGALAASGWRTTSTGAPGPIASPDEYFAWYTSFPQCTDPPVPGNTLSSATLACSGVNFTLSMSTPPAGLGLTYQWQRADDNFTTNIVNLGTGSTQVTNQTATSWYRCLVTCGANPAVGSAPIQVTFTSTPAICLPYCVPVTSTGCTDGDVIAQVILNTLNNNSGTGCPSGLLGYSNYTTADLNANPNLTTTLQAGTSYGCQVWAGQYAEGYAAWIDYNDDGVFADPAERIGNSPTQVAGSGVVGVLGSSVTFPIVLACNPPLGIHRLRVRCMYAVNGPLVTPCTNNTFGETEDYLVTITAADPCPAPFALNVSGNNGTSVNLGWTLGCAEALWDVHVQVAGGPAPGVPSNPSVTNPYNYTFPGAGVYEYYVRAVCTPGSLYSSWSGPYVFATNDECAGAIPLTVGAAGTCPGADVVGTTSGATASADATPTCLLAGLTDVWYSFYSGSNTVIQWNVTLGTMSAIGVQVVQGCGGAEVYCLPNLQTGTFSVATNTNYLFRVLTLAANTGTFNICLQAGPPPSCATNMSPANGGTVCPTSPTTLSWTADPLASSYEVYVDGGLVATQAGTTYNAGILSGAHTWSVIPIGNGPATGCPTLNFTSNVYECYCASVATYTADEEIYSVTVNGVTNGDITPYPGTNTGCSTVAPGAGSLLSQYSNFRPLGAIFSVQKGISSTFTIQEDECDGPFYYANGAAIWIDYDQNGTFDDVTEKVFVENATTTGPRNIVGNFLVPMNALTGTTAMRVTVAESLSGAALLACMTSAQGYYYGETEDYLVDILPPPVPASATATPLNALCGSGLFTIDVNIANFGSGTPGDIVYTVNGGSPINVGAALGSNIIGGAGFTVGDVIAISVTNNTVSTYVVGTFTDNCPVDITCGNTYTVTNYCYGNTSTKTWTFIGDNPNETLTLTFVSGMMAPGDVIRAYSGTDNNAPSITGLTGNFADLTGATGTSFMNMFSNGNEIFLEIDSDPTGSCQDNDPLASSWTFEVECTPGCVDPDGSTTYDLCTQMITVDVFFEGDGLSVGVRYIVNGGTPVDDPGPYYANDQIVLGPFTPGQSVQVYLLHENDGACNKNLGTTNIVAPVGQPILVTSATPATICSGQTSVLNAVATGGQGPIANYVYQTSTGGTLMNMSGATVLLGAGLDDSASPLTSIGFTMPFANGNQTQFTASSNGQMALGGSNASLTNNLATGTPRPLITCWWDDLHTGSDGYVQTKLFGSPGSYIRVVEWYVRDYPGTGLPATMLMQAWLYQNGTIELHYGAASAVSDGGASIGIGGATSGVFRSITSPAHTESQVTENTGNSVWPGDGRIYRFLTPEVSGTTYAWSPAGSISGAPTGNTVTTTALSGTEIYTVSATPPGGCPVQAQVTVTVNPPISLASITPDPANVCTGGSVTLTAVAGNGVPPYTYQWTGPGGPAGTASTQVATAGLWSVVITDNCPGGTANASVTVGSVAPPTANISASSPICVGGSVTLTCNTNTGTLFSWTGAAPVGGSTAQVVTINSLTAANNGTYTVVASNGGCPSAPFNYVLNVNPTPSISTTTATPNPVCSGSNTVLNVNASLPSGAYCTPTGYCGFPDIITNVTFAGINRSSTCDDALIGYSYFASPSATATAGLSYPISVTTGGDVEGAAVWIDYDKNGTFDASELVLNGFLGSNPATYTGNVLIPLLALNGTTRMRVRCTFYGDPTTNGAGPCGAVSYGETEDYNITISGGATPFTYAWSGGTFLGGITNTQSVTATNVTVAGPYSVLVTSGAGCPATGSVPVTVGQPPVVTCGSYGPYCGSDPDVTLGGSPSGGVWSGTGVTGNTFDPSAGTQLLTYTYNDGVCEVSCQVTITVNSVDTDGDGIPDCGDLCPNLFGQPGDACNVGFGLGTIDGSCNCVVAGCTTDLTLVFQTDGVSNVGWEIRTQGNNTLVHSGGGVYPPSLGYNLGFCLPDGCYYLVVTDDGNDGFTSNGVQGGYVLSALTNGAGRLIDNRNNFLSGSTSQLANGEGFCLPRGNDRLIYTSCDKLDWKTSPCGGEYVVADDNDDVNATYPNGGVDNDPSNDGYQMWWYDPNGGYSFRRFQNHLTNNGFPASATRACHFKLNSWLGNQMAQGMLYNVKVRSRVDGNWSAWGAACRLMIDDAAAQCPRTKLMDIPDNPYLSCGQTFPIGTSAASRVFAHPVRRMNNSCNWVSANRYQFRFRIPAESIDITKTSAVGQYWVNVNAPLTCGKTYEVDVRASFNSGATWCSVSDPYGDVCLLTTANCFQEGGNQNMVSDNGTNLRMYPNPNRGDQLYLSLDAVDEGVETVSVDMYDTFGKRVSARTIPVQDGFINTVLELNGELAGGLYMVNITAGGKTYTQRLVIQP